MLKRLVVVKYLQTLKNNCRGLSRNVMNENSVHRVAQEGFKQGTHYDKSRPSYSDDLVSHVIQSLHKGKYTGVRYDVLELGAGTGKFTRKILEHLKDKPQFLYLATEPSEDFLGILRKQSPEIETQACMATEIPLPEQSVQNVICAQCFHWFATEDSLKEINRVLVPGGKLILVWNDKDLAINWVKKMEGVLTQYYDDTPRKISGKWKKVFEGCHSFRQIEHVKLTGVSGMKGKKNFVLDHYTSISVIAQLESRIKEEAIAKFQAVLDEMFTDEEEIKIPLASDFFCAEKVAI